jgi:ankyrin repeat protein
MSYDQERSVELAQLLIERGADIESKDTDASFHTVLYLAIHLENNRPVALLLVHGADATLTNQQGWTPLHTACL